MSKILQKHLRKAKTEKDVESAWRGYFERSGASVSTLTPSKVDFYAKRNGKSVLGEVKPPKYRLDKVDNYYNIIAQQISQLKQFQKANHPLPHILFMANADQWFILPTSIFLSYLQRNYYRWDVAPSSIGSVDKKLMKDLSNDPMIITKRYSVHDGKDFEILWSLIESLVTNNTTDINSPYWSCETPDDYKKELEEHKKANIYDIATRRELYLKREDITSGVWGKGNKTTSLQDVHTSFVLCQNMMNWLIKYKGTLIDQKILIYNAEFLDILYLYDIIQNNDVWLISENRAKLRFAENVFGGFIKTDHTDNFSIWETKMKFDIIVGNPPYNNPKGEDDRPNGSSLWPAFVQKSLSLLKDGGFLTLVHPCGWRKPCKLWKILAKQNQIHYLEIHNDDDGQKTFNRGIRYDWYILEKIRPYKQTLICDENANVSSVDLSKWEWLPHYDLIKFENLLNPAGGENCKIVWSNDYRTDKPWVSPTQSDEFKYPVALSLKPNEQRWCYSSKNDVHFGIPKVICNCNGGVGGLYPFNDFAGDYGMNKFCFGIPISSQVEGEDVVRALNTENCKQFIKAIIWNGFEIDHRVFEYLKKDFWKEFLK